MEENSYADTFAKENNIKVAYVENKKDSGESENGTSATASSDSGNSQSSTASSKTGTNSSSAATSTATQIAKVKIKSAKNKAKKSVLVKWKKVSGADGYQVQYSAKKSFKKKTSKTRKATKFKAKKLKKKKTYYFRVRAYKIVDGKKVYGDWSKVKVVKVKK